MLKKTGIALGVLLVLFITAVTVVPFFFKGKILAYVKQEANKNLQATIDFEDVSLSLWRSFPNLTVALKQLTIINKAPFAGDTLANIAELSTTIDLKSILFGNTIEVKAIAIKQPQILLHALKDGVGNWEIAAPAKAEAGPKHGAKKDNLHLAIQRYEISNGDVAYRDEASGMRLRLRGLNHQGSGDFSSQAFQLQTQTSIAAFSAATARLPILENIPVKLQANLEVTASENRVTLRDNALELGAIRLAFAGSVQSSAQRTGIDLAFKTSRSEFKDILSLLPAQFQSNLAGITGSGQLAVEGFVKGNFGPNDFPALRLSLITRAGMFQYPRMPAPVRNVNIEMLLENPGGNADSTLFSLEKFHLEFERQPLDARLHIRRPLSDPEVAGSLQGGIDLAAIAGMLPERQDLALAGMVNTALRFSGRASYIQRQEFTKLRADGRVSLQNIAYSAPDLPQSLAIKQAQLDFSPALVELSNLEVRLGESDLRAAGQLQHVLGFALGNQTLSGTLSLQSHFFDLNPWMAGPSNELRAVALPAKVEFNMNSEFDRLRFGELDIEQIRGVLVLKDQSLHLADLDMRMLKGTVRANGTYATRANQPPHLFFALDFKELSIPETFRSFLTAQKFVPIAASLQGKYGASIEISSDLDSTLTPLWPSLNSRGTARLQNAAIQDFPPLNMMADYLKMANLKKMALAELSPSFRIRDGRFYLNPLQFKYDNLDFSVSGSNGIDQTLDYSLQLTIPAQKLKAQTNSALNQLFKKPLDLVEDDAVVVDFSFAGTLARPEMRVAPENVVKKATGQVAGAARRELQQKKSALSDTAQAALSKQQEELERQKKEAEAKAKAALENAKKEAASKLKKLLKKNQ